MESARVTCLERAAQCGDVARVAEAFHEGQVPYEFRIQLKGALRLAAWNDFPEVVQQLLAAKVDVDAWVGEGRYSATWRVAASDCVAGLRVLIQSKANLEAGTSAGMTALRAACCNDNICSVEELVRAKACLNSRPHGFGPMHIAAQEGFLPLCRLLLEADSRMGMMNEYRMVSGPL